MSEKPKHIFETARPSTPAPEPTELLVNALQQIKKMKAEPVAPGFEQGPLILFKSCQRIAREALAAYEKAKPHA